MKKIIALILAAVMLTCVFTACNDKPSDENKEKPKLVVATSPDFPPFENLENGKVVSYTDAIK